MERFKFFKPLPSMIGQPCVDCGKPITENDVLVQENVMGGGNCLIHMECLKKLDEEPEPATT